MSLRVLVLNSAAEFARALATGEVAAPGVWLPEQISPHERFFERIAALGWDVMTEPRGTGE